MASQQKPYVTFEAGANEFAWRRGDISEGSRPQIRNTRVVMNASAASDWQRASGLPVRNGLRKTTKDERLSVPEAAASEAESPADYPQEKPGRIPSASNLRTAATWASTPLRLVRAARSRLPL